MAEIIGAPRRPRRRDGDGGHRPRPVHDAGRGGRRTASSTTSCRRPATGAGSSIAGVSSQRHPSSRRRRARPRRGGRRRTRGCFGATARASRRSCPTRASRRPRCSSATSRIELLAPTGADTPVGRFLAKRGPGMHHVAYEVDDVARGARRARGRRRRADRRSTRARACSGSRSPSSIPTPSTASSRRSSAVAEHLIPSASRSPSRAARSSPRNVSPASADAVERALAVGLAGHASSSTPDDGALTRRRSRAGRLPEAVLPRELVASGFGL